MPVYKDKERNTWYISIRKKDINGELKQLVRRGFSTKREAQEEEAKLKLSELDSSSSLTFFELYLDYMNFASTRLKTRTIYITENRLKLHVLPYFKNRKVENITTKDYIAWQKKLDDLGFSNEYKNTIHTNFSTILKHGVKYHGLKQNVASVVGGFKNPDEIKKEIEFWDFEEFNKFIKEVDDLVYNAFFTTLYYTGMRCGECQALTWNDINLETNIISIKKTLSTKIKGQTYILTSPKTKSSVREVLMPNILINKLSELYSYYKDFEGLNNDWFVFGGLTPLSETTLRRRKNNYCKLAKVKQIRIHDLRHSHASLLIDGGADIVKVAERLGHSDIQMTLNTYSHMLPSGQQHLVDILNKKSDKIT